MNPLLYSIKPDGLKKSLTGNILTFRLSEAKLVIIGAKVDVTPELAMDITSTLKKTSFPELVRIRLAR